MPTPAASASAADRLLEAQVSHHLARLDDASLAAGVARVADELLRALGSTRLDELADVAAMQAIAARLVTTAPGSRAATGLVDLVADVVLDGPADPHPLGEVVDRARVEVLLDRLHDLLPLVERALDRVTDTPVVGTVATRFMGRIAAEVLAANKAVADKVPGLGSLVSLGTGAASRMIGVADRQVDWLVAGTVGRGSTLAVRRLNHVVVETLRDPTTREAVLAVWDDLAATPVRATTDAETREQVHGVLAAGHDLLAAAARTDHAVRLVEALVEGFVDRFGSRTLDEILADLDLTRAEVVDDLVLLAPGVVAALRESGDLERLLRAELAAFYASPQARAALDPEGRPTAPA